MRGKGRFGRSRWAGIFHQMLVCLIIASVLAAALIGPRCHCRTGDMQIAAIACCKVTTSASYCGCRFAIPQSVTADAPIPSTPVVPCSCHDASPLAYTQSFESPRPIQPTTQSFCLSPMPQSGSVASCRVGNRSKSRFETSPKLCSRLCRFLI